MALSLPAFTTDLSFPFLYLRKMMGSLATAGVVNPSTDFIVSPSSGLQVQITSGVAFVQQTVNVEGSSAYNGLYMVLNDGTANPFNTITAPVSNPRIDQVILRIYDVNEQGLGGSSKAQLEWLVGTESASASLATMGPGLSNPGAATLPDNSLRLAYVLQTVGEASISSGNIVNVGGLTSWSSMILSTISAATGTTPASRLKGDLVQVKGYLKNLSGGPIATGTVVATGLVAAPKFDSYLDQGFNLFVAAGTTTIKIGTTGSGLANGVEINITGSYPLI